MTDLKQLYQEYGEYNVMFNQLNWPSPSVEYAWLRTKRLLHDEVVRIVNHLQITKKDIRIVDLGCGNGAFIIRLAQAIPDEGVTFLGLDISQPFVEYGKKAAKYREVEKRVSFNEDDFEAGGLPKGVDIVICSEVLEHLVKPEEILEKINKSLNMGGYLLLTTPNAKNWIKYPLFFLKNLLAKESQRRLKRELTVKEGRFKLAEEEQHLHVYGQDELVLLLGKSGFGVYKIKRSTTFFGGPFLDRHPFLLGLTMTFDAKMNLFNVTKLGWDNIVFARKIGTVPRK